MSTPDTVSSVVRTSGGVRMRGGGVKTRGGAIRLREGVWIRPPEKERSSNEDTDSGSSGNKLRTINGKVVRSRGNGQTMLGMQNSMGLPSHAWLEGTTPEDCIIHAQFQRLH
ncbi:hypothetical protein Tco_0884400 [Tanacetum coccineum]